MKDRERDALPDESGAAARLDLRVFTARRTGLMEPGRWNHGPDTTTHWRLYQHDAPGALLVHDDGGTMTLEPGRVYLLPSGRRFQSRCVAPFRQFYVHFDLVGFPGIALRDLFPGMAVEVPASEGFERAVSELGDALPVQGGNAAVLDPACECWVRGTLLSAMGRYLTAAPPENHARYRLRLTNLPPVLPALRHIHAALATRITNTDLAARCSLSEDHFIRRFTEAVGVSPARYVTERRVALAAQLLLFSDETVESIARRTGFGDRFYFGRVFARETGRPPAAFRRGPRP